LKVNELQIYVKPYFSKTSFLAYFSRNLLILKYLLVSRFAFSSAIRSVMS